MWKHIHLHVVDDLHVAHESGMDVAHSHKWYYRGGMRMSSMSDTGAAHIQNRFILMLFRSHHPSTFNY